MGVKDRIQGSRFTAEERMLGLGWFRVQDSRVYAVPFGFLGLQSSSILYDRSGIISACQCVQ